MKVYIAGPLFNDEQIAVIEKIENTLVERGYNFFSPRSIGKFDREPSMTSEFDKVSIVERNKEELLNSNRMVAILSRDPQGNFDIGTLWEMGYFMSRLISDNTSAWTPNTLMNRYIYPVYDPKDKDVVVELYGYLLTLVNMVRDSYIGMDSGVPSQKTTNLFAFNNLSDPDYDKIRRSTDLNFNIIDLAKQSSFKWTENTTVLIDDRPSLLFILLGMMTGIIEDNTGIRWSIGTASLKGYGSNIMIAHSTDYHIQIDVSGDVAVITDKNECTEMN